MSVVAAAQFLSARSDNVLEKLLVNEAHRRNEIEQFDTFISHCRTAFPVSSDVATLSLAMLVAVDLLVSLRWVKVQVAFISHDAMKGCFVGWQRTVSGRVRSPNIAAQSSLLLFALSYYSRIRNLKSYCHCRRHRRRRIQRRFVRSSRRRSICCRTAKAQRWRSSRPIQLSSITNVPSVCAKIRCMFPLFFSCLVGLRSAVVVPLLRRRRNATTMTMTSCRA
jgi:hypothetical protein